MNSILIKIKDDVILFQGTESHQELYFKARQQFQVEDNITQWVEVQFRNNHFVIPTAFCPKSQQPWLEWP